jgi:hypothetical protein
LAVDGTCVTSAHQYRQPFRVRTATPLNACYTDSNKAIRWSTTGTSLAGLDLDMIHQFHGVRVA